VEGSGEYFAGRTWRIAAEETGEVKDGPATVRFLQGTFTIEGGKFSAPGSSARGSKGVLLQETGSDGKDIPGSRIAIGLVTLRQARKAGAVA
jgi:hypothetical protein